MLHATGYMLQATGYRLLLRLQATSQTTGHRLQCTVRAYSHSFYLHTPFNQGIRLFLSSSDPGRMLRCVVNTHRSKRCCCLYVCLSVCQSVCGDYCLSVCLWGLQVRLRLVQTERVKGSFNVHAAVSLDILLLRSCSVLLVSRLGRSLTVLPL